MGAASLRLERLQRNAGKPLYSQIAEEIRAAVVAGALAPGDQLPPEALLAREAGVARLTIRQALDLLAREGLLERRQGVGTFVATFSPQLPVLAPMLSLRFDSATQARDAAMRLRLESARLRSGTSRLHAEITALRREMQALVAPTTTREHVPLSEPA